MLKRWLPSKKESIPVDVLTGYAQWAKNYPAKAHNRVMEIEEQAMLSLFPSLTNKVCLDLACGSGRYALIMQKNGAKQVFGLDYSADMLAQAKTTDPYFKGVRCPFLSLPFADETFDFIACGLAVGHEQNLKQTLAEMARILRIGGTILYSDIHPLGTLSGWQRTFRTETGQTIKLEHHLHLYSAHQNACQNANLTINTILEPLAGEQAPTQYHHFPAVLVIQAEKQQGSRGAGEQG